MTSVLILGSGPNVIDSRDWDRGAFDKIIVINNAWAVRPDWDYLICPDDFPANRRPVDIRPDQKTITSADYVPPQNTFGGFIYAGGTMAFTAGYWALHALRPSVIGFIGCDMVYSDQGKTHFYGTGSADPLRADISLRSLEAKSTRMRLIAAKQGCAMVNLSRGPSRLMLPCADVATLHTATPQPNTAVTKPALAAEAALGYMVASGKYWLEESRFDTAEIDKIDALWRKGDLVNERTGITATAAP